MTREETGWFKTNVRLSIPSHVVNKICFAAFKILKKLDVFHDYWHSWAYGARWVRIRRKFRKSVGKGTEKKILEYIFLSIGTENFSTSVPIFPSLYGQFSYFSINSSIPVRKIFLLQYQFFLLCMDNFPTSVPIFPILGRKLLTLQY